MTLAIPAPTAGNVVYLTTSLSRCAGGPFFSVSGLAHALTSRGASDLTVIGVYTNPATWAEDEKQWAATPTIAIPHRGLGTVLPLRDSLARHIDAASGRATRTIVHLHGVWTIDSVAIASQMKLLRGPLVISPRGMLEPWALAQRRLKKKLALRLWQWRLLAEADLLHATSQLEYEGIRQLGLRNPIAIIPNGIEAPPNRLALREAARSSSSPGEPLLRECVFLSRLHPKKGLPMLLQAWKRVAPAGWCLKIAGAGARGHDSEIRGLIQELGLADVTLTGDLRGEEKWRFLAGADLFVLPSYSENFGIAVAEAMAMGLPVITTRGTPWRVLEDRRLGWWVDANQDAIAAAVFAATSESPAALAERGRQARQYAVEMFHWAGIAARMQACYDWLLGSAPPPADIVFE